MVRTSCKSLLALTLLAIPLFSGSLVLEIKDPSTNPEAGAKHAALMARITACQRPEKTALTATAEGVFNGARKSIPLKVVPLSTSGNFAVMHEWPERGSWVIKVVAANPDYKNYTPAVLVPFEGNSVQWVGIKHYSHEPTAAEMAAALGTEPGPLARH